MQTPTLIYDGNCDFCQYCVDYLKKITKGAVKFVPYQQNTLHLTSAQCANSIYLVINEAQTYRGAAAAFKTLSYGQNNRSWYLYQNLPGFAFITENIYQWITKHRLFCFKIAKIVCGNPWQVGRLTFIFWSIIALLLLTFFVLTKAP